MKQIIIISIFLIFATSATYPQNVGTGYRIRLLKNVNPRPVSDYGYSALWGYKAPDGKEYAILGCYKGTSFIDITDTNNIREVDFLSCPDSINAPGIIREMKTYSHYAYIIAGAQNTGIQIVDLQFLPDSVKYVRKLDLPGHQFSHTISQSGPYLYINGANTSFSQGIAILDLSGNPELPVLRGRWNNLYVHDCRIINDTLWAANILDGKISVINVTDKDNPVTITSWINNPNPNWPHNIAFSNNRRFAFVTDEDYFGRLKVWDVLDILSPIYLTSFNPTPFNNAIVHNVETYNDYAFLAYYSAGVKVLNISNPPNPVELGWYDTFPENDDANFSGCWAVYYFPESNKLIASDRKRGLFVLSPNFSNPVSFHPDADFSVSSMQAYSQDTIQLIDASEGLPTSWNWVVTGPENKTSNLKNPRFLFSLSGYYSVKLSVSNSFGNDSITKSDVFRIITPLAQFFIIQPQSPYSVFTAQNDTDKVNFNWTKSGNSEVSYKMYFKKIGSSIDRYISSGNNGLDSFFVMRKSYLDSLAVQFGLFADSVAINFYVKAYKENDSLTAGNSIRLVIRTNTVGIQNISDIIPDKYNLYQNYPNPFNPETNIKFDLPKNSYVSLIMYDIAGKEILKLVNQNLQGGSYNYKLNASNLNSGVYFVRLISNDFTQTKKIVLLK